MLFDLARPGPIRFVTQYRIEFEISPHPEPHPEVLNVANQPRRPVQLRPRPRLYVLGDEQMMRSRWRHDCANLSDRVERLAGFVIELGRRMKKEAAVGQPYHGHPRAYFAGARVEGVLVNDPQVRSEIPGLRHERILNIAASI